MVQPYNGPGGLGHVSLEDAKRIATVLKKREIKVFQSGFRFNIVVFINEKNGKAAIGEMSLCPYVHRYGIDVWATYNGDSFWFKSEDHMLNRVHKEHREEVVRHFHGKSNLPDLNLDSFQIAW